MAQPATRSQTRSCGNNVKEEPPLASRFHPHTCAASAIITSVGDSDRHLNPLQGVVPAVALHGDDGIGHLHPAHDLAERRILPIQKMRIGHTDEKLGPGTVRIVGARHREDAPLVRFAVELCFDLVSGAAHAMRGPVGILAVWIASLDHEFWNYSMKGGAVVKPFLGQVDEVFHMAGRDIMKESEDDISDSLSLTGNRNRGSSLLRHVSHGSLPFLIIC